ncbi:hypothetical protein GCM10027047_07790 [Rhodococcus aerolatus]
MPDTTNGSPALRRLVTLMLVNLAVGLVVAGLTLVLHQQVLDHQLAASDPEVLADPAQRRALEQSLSATLWSRPGPAVAVALLYPLFLRRLRRHEKRGLRRTVVAAVAQLLALGWYAVGTGEPRWLVLLQVGHAVVVVGVLVAATRPGLRRTFGYPAPGDRTRAGHRAALSLVVLAPLVAELSWGSTRLSQLAGLLLYWPAYGAGALLVREVVRRRGGGLPAVLVLGVAYGVLEEGLALQSLTSPTLFRSITDLVPRVEGVNVGYALMVLTYHAVISIAAPIALAELVHPRVRRTPWLGARATVATAVVAALGLAVLRLVPITADPGYTMPWADDVVLAVLVLATVAAALLVLPRVHRPVARSSVAPPPPAVLAVASGVASLLFLGLLMPLPGARHAGWAPTAGGAWVAVAAATAAAVGSVVLARRWLGSGAWSPRHTVGALTGMLVAHTVIGLLSLVHTPLDVAGLAAVGVVEVGLLGVLARRTGTHRPVVPA